MKILYFLTILTLFQSSVWVEHNHSEDARCTGSAYCRACKNCNYCGHCNSGGSCGVCSSSLKYDNTKKSSTPYPNYQQYTPNPSYPQFNPNYNNSPSFEYRELPFMATVNIQQLNLREGPSTEFAILVVLKLGAMVEVIELTNSEWVKVNVVVFKDNEATTITGYLSRKYLH